MSNEVPICLKSLLSVVSRSTCPIAIMLHRISTRSIVIAKPKSTSTPFRSCKVGCRAERSFLSKTELSCTLRNCCKTGNAPERGSRCGPLRRSIEPKAEPMILRILSAEVCGPHTSRLSFNDGTRKEVDAASLLDGPVFEPLRDPAYFAKVTLDPLCGTVVWPNGADFTPEALHELAPRGAAVDRTTSG